MAITKSNPFSGAAAGPTVKRIPLHGRDGSVLAHALVDEADYELVAGYRWKLQSWGYARRYEHYRLIYMHRELLGLKPGDGKEVDHINGDKLDNRRLNLRIATNAQNAQNWRPRRIAGTSRFRGVSWKQRDRKWQAKVTINNHAHYLGRFDDEVEAAIVADAFRREHVPFAMPDPALAELAAPRDERRAA